MSKISVEEATKNLQAILEQVAKGEEVLLVQDGKIVARIVPPLTREQWIAMRDRSRDSIQLKGEPMSQTVIKLRSEERY
jgi:antitoxin (DNA-binding transcriptional repressor) of toxin-antitoxin stability system